MNLPDQVGRLDQYPGGPERVAQVAAAPLELGGQRAVEHDGRVRLQDRCDWIEQLSSAEMRGTKVVKCFKLRRGTRNRP